MSEYRIAGYVKLAKLWERSRDEAISFHVDYYKSKFENNSEMTLHGVYIDITGNKETWKRPNMVRLLRDCATNKIDCIATQTKLRTMNPQKPVGVYFETENIFTLNKDADQTLGFHALPNKTGESGFFFCTLKVVPYNTIPGLPRVHAQKNWKINLLRGLARARWFA